MDGFIEIPFPTRLRTTMKNPFSVIFRISLRTSGAVFPRRWIWHVTMPNDEQSSSV